MVPAADINIGKKRSSRVAANSTASYPATVAIEESTSMACARVVRGIRSMAIRVCPPAAAASAVSLEAPRPIW